MAKSEAPRPPSITPVPASAPPATSASNVPKISLPPETVRRWQGIVAQALSGGRDISVLVQQYAEQSFDTKLGSLDTQGARKRMLARAHAALEREHARAEAHLEAQPSIKPPIMTRSFQANNFDVPSPQNTPPAPPSGRHDKKTELEWHHTTTPVADPYTKRAELEGHMQKLVAQMAAIDKEIPTIDAVLNKGLRNQQSVVNELAAVSRELYRLAQEVRVETPTKRAPTDGSGYQKSVRKKDAGPSTTNSSTPAPAAEGPSHPPAETETPALPPRRKTVPLNPLMLASRRLGRTIDAATAKTAQVASAVLTPVAAAVGKAASTLSYVIGTALVMIFRPIGLGISLLVGAMARAYAASVERIKDIWPWRGPPPE